MSLQQPLKESVSGAAGLPLTTPVPPGKQARGLIWGFVLEA